MGWKGIWQRNPSPIEELIKIIQRLQDNTKEINKSKIITKVEIISDTIIIHSGLPNRKEQTVLSALQTHYDLCSNAIAQSIEQHIPLRGATSFGVYYYNQDYSNTFVGPAIDEVASWYETADWIGVFMTPSLRYYLNESKENVSRIEKCGWVIYQPPFKPGIDKYTSYCVDWLKKYPYVSDNGEINIETIKKHFWEMNFGVFTQQITSKYENTLKFISEMNKKTQDK